MKASIHLQLSPDVSLVLVRPGTFMMGDEEDGYNDEKPEHPVTLTQPFYLSRHPVTQAQWAAVTGSNPSEFSGLNRPVENVSWNDVMRGEQENGPEEAFVDKVTPLLARQHPELTGWMATLPTEAQWEYAAKGGHLAPPFSAETAAKARYPRYAGGDAITAAAWTEENNDYATVSVGLRQPNALGLYGMSGNVWEWCRDAWNIELYRTRAGTEVVDPEVEGEKNDSRVQRGGSWFGGARFARPATRYGNPPVDRYRHDGFRLCLVPPVR